MGSAGLLYAYLTCVPKLGVRKQVSTGLVINDQSVQNVQSLSSSNSL